MSLIKNTVTLITTKADKLVVYCLVVGFWVTKLGVDCFWWMGGGRVWNFLPENWGVWPFSPETFTKIIPFASMHVWPILNVFYLTLIVFLYMFLCNDNVLQPYVVSLVSCMIC